MKKIKIRHKRSGKEFDATPEFAQWAIKEGYAEAVTEPDGQICQVWDLSNEVAVEACA